MAPQLEGLALLHDRFDKLNRASEASVLAAWEFGQCIDVLAGPPLRYALTAMAAEVDRTPQTVAKYRTLYVMFPNFEELKKRYRRLRTYDISRLIAEDDAHATGYGYQCQNCQSWDTRRLHRPVLAKAGA